MDGEQIQRAALALPEAARAELAYGLLQDLNPISADGRRNGEMEGGELPAIPSCELTAEWRKVHKAALALPEAEQDELCHKLLMSLEPQEGRVSEEEAEAYWIQEAERRLARRRRGEVQTIPYEQVLRELREARESLP